MLQLPLHTLHTQIDAGNAFVCAIFVARLQHVGIGQILRRNSQRVSATFNSEVISLNLQLASACALHDNISFWKQRGFWASLDFLSSDGVHIREDMNKKVSTKLFCMLHNTFRWGF